MTSIVAVVITATALGIDGPRPGASEGPGANVFIPPDGWDRYPAYAAPPLVAVAPDAKLAPEISESQPQVIDSKKEVAVHADAHAGPKLTSFGLLIDAGIPDGAGVSVIYRPLTWIRFHGGIVNNTVSSGFRGGVSWIPFYAWFTPTLTAEAGHFFSGDASWIERRFSTNPASTNAFNIGYDFANAHLGLELGSPRRLSFFLRAGLSYVQATAAVQPVIQDKSIQAKDLRMRGVFPSAKLGLMLYFL